MIRYLIFDFDGTLVDSQNVVINVYNQLAGKYKANMLRQEDVAYFKGLSIAVLNWQLYHQIPRSISGNFLNAIK